MTRAVGQDGDGNELVSAHSPHFPLSMVFMAAKRPFHPLPKSDHKIRHLWHSTHPSPRVHDCEISQAEERRLRRTQLDRSSLCHEPQTRFTTLPLHPTEDITRFHQDIAKQNGREHEIPYEAAYSPRSPGASCCREPLLVSPSSPPSTTQNKIRSAA